MSKHAPKSAGLSERVLLKETAPASAALDGVLHAAWAATSALIDLESQQHLAMLRILYGASATALDAFQAADNPVDAELVADLGKMVERTRLAIERLTTHLADPP